MGQTQPSTSPEAKSMRTVGQCQMDLNKAAFEVWEHQNLVDFCYAAEAKLIEQDDRIQQLQCDLKDALKVYRELLTNKDDWK